MRHEKTVSVSKIRLLWEPWKEDETPRNCIPVGVNQVMKGIEISQWPSHV